MPIAVLLLTLGLGQLISSYKGWRAALLTGPNCWLGYGVGALLVLLGGLGVMGQNPAILGWTVFAGPLAIGLLLLAGSYVKPPLHPDRLFDPRNGNCEQINIPDGEYLMPALLLKPLSINETGAAVCLVHGSGDTKHGFKWRLVQALLNRGLTVLTIDLPGHGEYRRRVLSYPDCLSALPAAVKFLRTQPGIERIGALGISLGGAMVLKSLERGTGEQGRQGGITVTPYALRPMNHEAIVASSNETQIDALAILGTPLRVNYSRGLVYREAWRALRAPVLSLFGEISARQMRNSWLEGGVRSRHSTDELFTLLDPLDSMRHLSKTLPILLVYSQSDPVAPASFGRRLQQVVPHAKLLTVKKASHVTLILMPEVNYQVADWLRKVLRHD